MTSDRVGQGKASIYGTPERTKGHGLLKKSREYTGIKSASLACACLNFRTKSSILRDTYESVSKVPRSISSFHTQIVSSQSNVTFFTERLVGSFRRPERFACKRSSTSHQQKTVKRRLANATYMRNYLNKFTLYLCSRCAFTHSPLAA